ncbi:hypothetical protein Tco_1207936 [Tanacetum coccineum]
METINVTFNELSAMAFEQRSLKPEFQGMTSRQISSGLDLTYAPSTIKSQKPTERELDLLFEPMYNDYIGGQALDATRIVPAAPTIQNLQTPNASTTIANSAPTLTNSSSQLWTDGEMCIYALSMSTMEPSNVNEAITDPGWIESMQEELLQLLGLMFY